MKPERSWTRRGYADAYRMMKRGFSFEFLSKSGYYTQEELKAADYSYQAFGYDVNAWSSDDRRKRFNAILWRVLTKQEVYPF